MASLADYEREWFGYLTTENCEAVADRIRSMLTDVRYTWVACVSWIPSGWTARPEVRTGQKLKSVTASLDPSHAHISVSDDYGAWGISGCHASQAEARAGEPQRQAYLHFQHSHGGWQLEIEHYSSSGNRLQWTIAVEPGDE